MRLILAVLATLASLTMLAIGGMQYVSASQQTTVTASGTTDSTAPLMVVDDEVLASRAGAQLVQIEGEGDIVVVIGRTSDVAAWVGDAKHTTVSIADGEVRDGKQSLTFVESGTETEVPNPLTADQWFERHEGNGSFRLDTVVAPGYSMLIASDGTSKAPSTLSVTWPAAGYAPFSGPLLVGGAVLLLIALALWAWWLRHRKLQQLVPAATATPVESHAHVSEAQSAEGWNAVPWQYESAPEPHESWAQPRTDAAPPRVDADREAYEREAPTASVPTQSGAIGASYAEHSADRDAAVADADRDIAAILAEHDPDARQPHDAFARPQTEQRSPATSPAASGSSPFAPAWATPTETTFEPVNEPATAENQAPPASFGTDIAAPQRQAGDANTGVEDAYAPEPFPESTAEPVAVGGHETQREYDQVADYSNAPMPAQPEAAPQPEASSDDEDRDDDDESKWRRPRGRNRSSAPKRVFFAPMLVVASLGLAGCAPQYWPADWTNTDVNPQATPTSSVDAAIIEEGAHPPALNDKQIEAIIDDAAAVAAEADKKKDAKALEARFTGDALALRDAHYRAHAANEKNPMPAPFPTGEIAYSMPEASDQWPRTLFTVVKPPTGADGKEQAPYGIMLTQENPRANYKVASVVQLTANVSLPDAAPTAVGSPSLANAPEPLVIEPNELAAAYADVIAKGDKSEHASKFEAEGDVLRGNVNDAYRKQETDAIDAAVAKLSFEYKATDTKPLGMVGLQGGAIVTVSIRETETLKAANDRARIKVTGLTSDLAGIKETATGFSREYTDQLLFYVPAASEGGKVQFLGVSQSMTSARQLSEEEVAR